MGAAYFYHLTRAPMEQMLPMLLDRAMAAGWRVQVRGVDPGRMDWLDQKLWQGPDDGFLPHGLAGGPQDDLQPVLLTITGQEITTKADCLMSIDGSAVTSQEVDGLERVCVLFDGTDPEAVQTARVQWKELTAAGCKAQYWSEESGRWEKKAES